MNNRMAYNVKLSQISQMDEYARKVRRERTVKNSSLIYMIRNIAVVQIGTLLFC